MSNSGIDDPRNISRTTEQPDAAYLGPGTVVVCDRNELRVQLDDGTASEVAATTAFTFPHEPVVGDRLLILGQADAYYAVGVLSGSKPTTLAFQGDANIRTIQGRLTLSSDRAIDLRAPRITIRAGVLRTIADRVTEKAGNFRRWVRDLLSTRAGRSRRVVDGEDSTRCTNSTTLAKDTVKIDGDQLHLGH